MLIWPKSLFQICLCSSLLVATYGDAHQSWGLKLVPNVEAGLLLFDGFLVLVELIPNLSWSFNMANPALVLTSFLGQSVRENKLWLWPLKFGYVNSQRIPIKLQCCWLYFFFPLWCIVHVEMLCLWIPLTPRGSRSFLCLRDALELHQLFWRNGFPGADCCQEQQSSAVGFALKMSACLTPVHWNAARQGRYIGF